MNCPRFFISLVASLICLSDVAAAKEPLPQRFKITGSVLSYDTETDVVGEPPEIDIDDIDAFRTLLADNPQVTEVQLNSGGGQVYASREIAQIILAHGLNTVVESECVSACIGIFLAGERRRMRLGAKVGFHQRSWNPDSVQTYYRKWRDDEDWATPFEFGSWIYEDTQDEIYEHLTYMISRGVEAAFAVKTLKVGPDDVWYPSRLQLIAAGVLREQLR